MSLDILRLRRALGGLQRRNLELWRIVDHVWRAAQMPLEIERLETAAGHILSKIEQQAPALVSELRELHEEYPRDLVSQFVTTLTQETHRALEAAMFIYAHAILDSTATDLCQLLIAAEPFAWERTIFGKKITYQEVRDKERDCIRDELLAGYGKQLDREPLTKRIDLLNVHCQPAPLFSYDRRPFKYDAERIARIDKIRQAIMHRIELTKAEGLHKEATYLQATAHYVIFLVQYHLGITVSATEEIYSEAQGFYQSKAMLSTITQELLAGGISIDQVIARRGVLYLRDENQHLMPLAIDFDPKQARLSHDKNRVTYVMQRYGESVSLSEEDGYDPGVRDELWISNRDGTHPRCLVVSGECPNLHRKALPEAFGNRIENIHVPAWSNDDQNIYFLAPMWTTSGAIFRTGLDGTVEFFTDGNWFKPITEGKFAGCLLVSKHKYWPLPPDYDFEGDDPRPFGAYDHLWLVDADGAELKDLGDAGANSVTEGLE